MKLFKYKKFNSPVELEEARLNALGKQGWELCGVTTNEFGCTYYIKKEIDG